MWAYVAWHDRWHMSAADLLYYYCFQHIYANKNIANVAFN